MCCVDPPRKLPRKLRISAARNARSLAKAVGAKCGHKASRRRIVDAYFSREHFDDRDGCCPLLGTASDVERRGEMVKIAYQEVVEQMIKVFEDHLKGPRPHERALALVALCVGGMVLARNVCDSDLADNFRRSAHAEVLRTARWK